MVPRNASHGGARPGDAQVYRVRPEPNAIDLLQHTERTNLCNESVWQGELLNGVIVAYDKTAYLVSNSRL